MGTISPVDVERARTIESSGKTRYPSDVNPWILGCTHWRAEMTTEDPRKTCRVTFVMPDGRSRVELVSGASRCGKPQGGGVYIESLS